MDDRRVHWFFSLGTSKKTAIYLLTPEIVRMRRWFPRMDDGARPVGERQQHEAHSATAALTHLLGPPTDGARVVFHLIPTEEVTRGGFAAVCAEEAAPWSKAGIEAAIERRRPVGTRDPATVNAVVRQVIEGVSDGDAVFIDSTGGLRPFSMGFLLAQPVLRALKPGVEIAGVVYAEFGALESLSPIYDLTEMADLPLWATAAADLNRRLDGTGLAALLPEGESTLKSALVDLAVRVDLGWPDEAESSLRQVRAELHAQRPGRASGQAEVALLARDLLDPILGDFPHGTTLDRDRLAYQLRFVDALARSGRPGAALRVLREVLVNAALVAMSPSRAVQLRDALDRKARAAAERALFMSKGDVKKIWDEVCRFRNAVAHSRYNPKYDDIGPTEIARAASANEDSLLTRARALVAGDLLEFGPPSRGLAVFHVKEGPPPEPEALGRAFDLDPKRVSLIDLQPAKGGARGKNWADDKAKKAAGFPDAVLMLADHPTDLVLLSRALDELGVRPWALHGAALQPLFPGERPRRWTVDRRSRVSNSTTGNASAIPGSRCRSSR